MARRGVAALALAAFVAVAAAAPAMGASTASLQKQINQLKKRVAQLEWAVDAIYNCQSVVPITGYGDPDGSYGYLWQWGDGTTIRTTAIDYVGDVSGFPPDEFDWVVVVDNTCVNGRAVARQGSWAPAEPPLLAGKAVWLRRLLGR